jgi:hypothetical protein
MRTVIVLVTRVRITLFTNTTTIHEQVAGVRLGGVYA